MSDYVVGIDLHGTLLDENWQVKEKYIDRLNSALEGKEVYVCSGNDLTFIHKHVPKELNFKGYILETGCVTSDGQEETVIVPDDKITMIKELEGLLKGQDFKEVLYFGRRLATVSLFTKSETEGVPPDRFYEKVKPFVESHYGLQVFVTHSDVAVDILPRGFNKFKTIMEIAKDRKIVGIADSLNDFHLIAYADYGFIPANASQNLLEELAKNRMEPVIIDEAELKPFQVVQSNMTNTDFVIESLEFLTRNH